MQALVDGLDLLDALGLEGEGDALAGAGGGGADLDQHAGGVDLGVGGRDDGGVELGVTGAEGLDHVPSGVGPLVAVEENEPRAGNVQGEAVEGEGNGFQVTSQKNLFPNRGRVRDKNERRKP